MENEVAKSPEQRAISLLSDIFRSLPRPVAPAEVLPVKEGDAETPPSVSSVEIDETDKVEWTIQPAAVRAKQKMTQDEFGAALRIPAATIRNWEQQRVVPDPAARALLTMLDTDPKTMAALDKAWRPKAPTKLATLRKRMLAAGAQAQQP